MSTRTMRMKDGREAVIRRATLGDCPGLVESWKAMARDGRGMVTDESEKTLESAQKSVGSYIDGENAGDNGACFVAVLGGRVVGDANVRRLNAAKVRHVAVLGLGVHPEFQALGLGRALMESVIEWSIAQCVVRLELKVRCDNDRAMRLYESLGFVTEGVRARFILETDGRFVDDATMVRFLDEEERPA